MSKQWSEERKQAAKEAYAARKAGKKSAEAGERIRIPLGAKRDLLGIQNKDPNYNYRLVNDTIGRIERFEKAGYEFDENAKIGTSHADGNQADSGVVSRDVGRGVKAYAMRQRRDWYEADQAKKQRDIDETENSMRRKKVNPNESTDGSYGEVKIG